MVKMSIGGSELRSAWRWSHSELAPCSLSKSKKHFVGLIWDNNGQKGGIAFQADKTDYRGLLAGLEGITGKKAINSDTMTVKN